MRSCERGSSGLPEEQVSVLGAARLASAPLSAFDFLLARGTLDGMQAPPSAPDPTGHFGQFGGMFVPEP